MAVPTAPAEETTQLWEQVLAVLRGRLESHQAFETWFRPIIPLTLNPEFVELQAPNAFLVDWIHTHYLPLLRHSIAEVVGPFGELRLSVSASGLAPLPPREPVRATDPGGLSSPVPTRAPVDGLLHPDHTFENFVVGSGNQFTHAACLAVAQSPGNVYNPLFVFGGSGLGKTHLLQAIGHAVHEMRPTSRICYVSAERFTNEMIYSIQHAQTLAFRNKYRNVDLLLIDDIQFLAG
jgi:chromosomal replication initiator protein